MPTRKATDHISTSVSVRTMTIMSTTVTITLTTMWITNMTETPITVRTIIESAD